MNLTAIGNEINIVLKLTKITDVNFASKRSVIVTVVYWLA
jgi:hypothetical protein